MFDNWHLIFYCLVSRWSQNVQPDSCDVPTGQSRKEEVVKGGTRRYCRHFFNYTSSDKEEVHHQTFNNKPTSGGRKEEEEGRGGKGEGDEGEEKQRQSCDSQEATAPVQGDKDKGREEGAEGGFAAEPTRLQADCLGHSVQGDWIVESSEDESSATSDEEEVESPEFASTDINPDDYNLFSSDSDYNPDREQEESTCEEEFMEDEATSNTKTPPKKKKASKFATPAADANPSGPSPRRHQQPSTSRASTSRGSQAASHDDNDQVWTSHLSRVPVHDFTGDEEEPVGPRFPPQSQIAPTTPEETRAWLGMRIVMGLCIISDVDDYWSTHPGFRNELISRTMTKSRFNYLNTHLACLTPTSILKTCHQPMTRRSSRSTCTSAPMLCTTSRRSGLPFSRSAGPCTIAAESWALMRQWSRTKDLKPGARSFSWHQNQSVRDLKSTPWQSRHQDTFVTLWSMSHLPTANQSSMWT